MQPGVHNKCDLGSEGYMPYVGICSRWGPSINDVMHEGFVCVGGGLFPFPFAEKGYHSQGFW